MYAFYTLGGGFLAWVLVFTEALAGGGVSPRAAGLRGVCCLAVPYLSKAAASSSVHVFAGSSVAMSQEV